MNTKEWQPIETAPKDGTPFLALVPHRKGFVAPHQGVEKRYYILCFRGKTFRYAPTPSRIFEMQKLITHWMPLPDPPKEEE